MLNALLCFGWFNVAVLHLYTSIVNHLHSSSHHDDLFSSIFIVIIQHLVHHFSVRHFTVHIFIPIFALCFFSPFYLSPIISFISPVFCLLVDLFVCSILPISKCTAEVCLFTSVRFGIFSVLPSHHARLWKCARTHHNIKVFASVYYEITSFI